LKKLKNKGVAEPPTLAGLGWLNHPPWGGSGGGSATPKGQTLQILFFPFCPWGGQTTPRGHRGGSATPKLVEPPLRAKPILPFFIYFYFFLSKGWPNHPQPATPFFFKKKLINFLINF
jgi:hypothetical protein